MDVGRAALDGVEQDGVDELDDRRRVLRDPVDREGLFPLFVLTDELKAEVFGGLVQHPLRGLALLEDVGDAGAASDLDLERQSRQELELVQLHDVRRIGADDRHRLLGALLRDERVAEHPLDRNRSEEVGVHAERRHVHVRQAQAFGQGERVRFLLFPRRQPDCGFPLGVLLGHD